MGKTHSPYPHEMAARVEAMLADECPIAEIARTVHTDEKRIAHLYPQARSPIHERGQQAAMARKFNRLPNTLQEIRKTK